MPKRVSPIETIRADIETVFGSGKPIEECLEDLMRHSVRLVLQQVLEDEVTTWLGRGWNRRSEPERQGQRNGHGDLSIKTTAGPVDLKRPKLRNTTETFASQLLGKGVVRSAPLEALVISAWVRGLSDRDIEALLGEALGPDAALSKSTASRICQALRDDFEAFRNRDLSGIDLDYLFLDGSHFKMHEGTGAEPVMVAYGITTVGQPVLVAVEPAAAESTDAWADFCDDLTSRGLKVPLLTITDGAAGLINAVDSSLHGSLRQRCLVHRARNVLAKIPVEHQATIKAEFWACFDNIEVDPGQAAVDEAQRRIDAFAARHHKAFPAAVRCIEDDRLALTAFLRFPAEHHKRIRHTNLIERTFGETRRRVKVIGRLPGEASCLALVWAVLDRASAGWRGLRYTPTITRTLTDIRHQLNRPTTKNNPTTTAPDDTVTTAA
ncbi:MAG: IS256 family transposase [bacterium]|nr:IS256 family transposase [bacterium]